MNLFSNIKYLNVTLGILLAAGCTFAPDPGGMPGDDPDDPMDPGPDSGPVTADAGVIPPDADTATLRCQAAIGGMVFDWEGDAQGWEHDRMPAVAGEGNYWRWEHWEHGPVSSGPGACRGDSTGCWATNLDDNYISCQRGYLASPALDLTECQGVDIELVFHHWYDFWVGEERGERWYDGGLVELSVDGETWDPVEIDSYDDEIAINPRIGSNNRCVAENEFHVHRRRGFIQSSQGWQRVAIAIPEAYRVPGFRVRFVYGSGVSYPTFNQDVAMQYTRPGWYLDDLAVELGGAP